jgi:hypothetical protein
MADDACSCGYTEDQHCECGGGKITKCKDPANPNCGQSFYSCEKCGYEAFHGINGYKWITNWRSAEQKEALKEKKRKFQESKEEKDGSSFNRLQDGLNEVGREVKLVRQTMDALLSTLKKQAEQNLEARRKREAEEKQKAEAELIEDEDGLMIPYTPKASRKKTTAPPPQLKKK